MFISYKILLTKRDIVVPTKDKMFKVQIDKILLKIDYLTRKSWISDIIN